jgi:hypothetical protein
MREECCEGTCECTEEGCSCDKERFQSAMVMGLANAAWAELMKEKMKKAYEKAIGAKMDKIAALGVEANLDYWKGKMQEKSKWADFDEKLKKAMSDQDK